ncbi:MAG: hypothetical protein ABIK67_05410 [candidate division WOR-3 bacterium]
MNAISRFCLLLVFLVSSSCAKTSKEAFKSYVSAVQKGDVKKISELDYEIVNQLKEMFKSDKENFLKSFADDFSLPATTANIESYRGYPPFGVKSCQYAPKVFFPADAKVEVIDVIEKEEYGEKKALLQVSVTYPDGKEPYHVQEVDIVWHEPAKPSGGLYIPPIKPIPMFTPGFFEHNHPFRNNPKYFARYTDYDLSLKLKEVKKALLKIEMIYNPEVRKWFFKDVLPDFSKSEYK